MTEDNLNEFKTVLSSYKKSVEATNYPIQGFVFCTVFEDGTTMESARGTVEGVLQMGLNIVCRALDKHKEGLGTDFAKLLGKTGILDGEPVTDDELEEASKLK